MKLLVFGKSGQVATELQRSASDQGMIVTAFGRDDLDLCNPEQCDQVIESLAPDVVINAAAYTQVDQAEQEETLAHMINAQAPMKMAQATLRLGIPFLHISTDYVFDGAGDKPFSPDDTPNPLGVYGQSKLVGEKAVAAIGGQFAILRTSWVFSAHGKNFVKTMLRLAESHKELGIVCDQIGGPTAAKDIADTLLAMAVAMRNDPTISGVFHLSGAPEVSWAGFAREIFGEIGSPVVINEIETSEYPTPAVRPLNSRLDCTSLTEVFGIPQPDWLAALKRVIKELGE